MVPIEQNSGQPLAAEPDKESQQEHYGLFLDITNKLPDRISVASLALIMDDNSVLPVELQPYYEAIMRLTEEDRERVIKSLRTVVFNCMYYAEFTIGTIQRMSDKELKKACDFDEDPNCFNTVKELFTRDYSRFSGSYSDKVGELLSAAQERKLTNQQLLELIAGLLRQLPGKST